MYLQLLAGLGVLCSLLLASSGEKLDSALSLVSQPRHEQTRGHELFPDQDHWFPNGPIFLHRHRKIFQSTPTSGSQTYSARIVPGDTLNAIAERFGVTVDALVKANNIQDADKINAGDTLVIPSEGQTRTYTVVAGDTLTIIATRFNSTVQELTQLNDLANPDSIVVGQMLRVPAGSSPLPDQTSPPPSPPPPSPTPPSPSQTAPASSLTTTIPRVVHRTCPSDTLESLAKLYNTTKEEIMKSNSLTSATQKLTAELFIPTTTEPTFLTYTVKSGDMLAQIANRNELTPQQLLEDNPELKPNPNLIFPGQQLRLRQSPTQESVGGNCTDGSTPTPTPPAPRPDNQGGMSTTDLLRLVLAPVLTGVAAICTIAYTLWKCHQKGRLFKEHRKSKRAASGSDRRGSELGSTTTSITPAGSTAVALDNIPITLVGKPVYALREVVNQAGQAPGGNTTRPLRQQRGPVEEEEDKEGFFRDQQRPVESVHRIQRHL